MNPSESSSAKADRKTIEKNRRNKMKNLYSQLNSLVPHQGSSSGEPMTLPDQIDEATNYIKQLQMNVEELKQTRDSLRSSDRPNGKSKSRRGSSYSPVQIDVTENCGALEVTLVTGLECQFFFNEVIRILHEENADVLNASYSVVEDTAFHTIHAQVHINIEL
uniref:BHLH domain-containing protein n=1 Tax=Opuntia streptacantha TaxID=393608 RepID=A0A7C9D6J0_OPUST